MDNSGKFLTTDGSNLSWTNLTISGEIVGIKGDKGDKGDPGSVDICLNDYSDVSFGNVDISGVLSGNSEYNNILNYSSHLIPTINDTFDIGSVEYKVRDLYVSYNSIFIGDKNKIDVDETTGSLIIRKRKDNKIPSGLFDNITNQELEIIGIEDKNNIELVKQDINQKISKQINSLTEMKLGDWKKYSDVLNNIIEKPSKTINEIFKPNESDDWEEEKNLNNLLNNYSDVSFGFVEISGNLKINNSEIALKTDITTAINNLVNGAPGNLDTLNELAHALENSSNFASVVTTKLSNIDSSLSYLDTKSDVSFTNVSVSNNINASNFIGDGSLLTNLPNPITEFVITANGGKYFIDNIQTPELTLDYNKTYRFKQDDSSNGTHPLRFYTTDNNTSIYSSGVTIIGTQGTTGSYSEIIINSNTPNTLYYQCSAHPDMGGKLNIINYPLKFSQIDVSINDLINNGSNNQTFNLTDYQDASFTNVDISGILSINDYSFPQYSSGTGGQVLKLNTNATQLEWADISGTSVINNNTTTSTSNISGNILQVRGNIVFDNILLKNDELLNIQSVHTLEHGFLKAKQGTQLFLDSHIIPTSDETFDLGSAAYKIRHLFLSDNSLWIGDEHKIDVSNGELKFKKRKKNFIPQKIKDLSNSLNSIDDIKNLSNKFNNINDLSSMKLNDWLLVNKELKKLNPTIPDLKVEDIFNDSSDNWVQNLDQNQKILELENKIQVLTDKLNTLLSASGYQEI